MAKKYIDAELIKSTRALYFDIDACITELIRARTEQNEENEGKALFRMEGLMVATMQQLDCIIDSLQQEQPSEKTCKKCGFYENNCPYIRGKFIPYPSKVCEDYTYSVVKAQEQLSEDLEKEIDRLWESFADEMEGPHNLFDIYARLARHFANWQKEQMMKEAVEGYVNYYEDSGGILMAEAQVGCPYHIGDKVRIIIVKEGEK